MATIVKIMKVGTNYPSKGYKRILVDANCKHKYGMHVLVSTEMFHQVLARHSL